MLNVLCWKLLPNIKNLQDTIDLWNCKTTLICIFDNYVIYRSIYFSSEMMKERKEKKLYAFYMYDMNLPMPWAESKSGSHHAHWQFRQCNNTAY